MWPWNCVFPPDPMCCASAIPRGETSDDDMATPTERVLSSVADSGNRPGSPSARRMPGIVNRSSPRKGYRRSDVNSPLDVLAAATVPKSWTASLMMGSGIFRASTTGSTRFSTLAAIPTLGMQPDLLVGARRTLDKREAAADLEEPDVGRAVGLSRRLLHMVRGIVVHPQRRREGDRWWREPS